jgi:hypothetical protein
VEGGYAANDKDEGETPTTPRDFTNIIILNKKKETSRKK